MPVALATPLKLLPVPSPLKDLFEQTVGQPDSVRFEYGIQHAGVAPSVPRALGWYLGLRFNDASQVEFVLPEQGQA